MPIATVDGTARNEDSARRSPEKLASSFEHIPIQTTFCIGPIDVAAACIHTFIAGYANAGEEGNEITNSVDLANRIEHRATH